MRERTRELAREGDQSLALALVLALALAAVIVAAERRALVPFVFLVVFCHAMSHLMLTLIVLQGNLKWSAVSRTSTAFDKPRVSVLLPWQDAAHSRHRRWVQQYQPAKDPILNHASRLDEAPVSQWDATLFARSP